MDKQAAQLFVPQECQGRNLMNTFVIRLTHKLNYHAIYFAGPIRLLS